VLKSSGSLDEKRLRSNLLSSMPMCFNLFGSLRSRRAAAAAPLARAFELEIAEITMIEVEWAPPPEKHLGDRTAFDAYIEYRRTDGQSGFIGVETKYTEPFSPQPYDRPRYRELTEAAPEVLQPEAASALISGKTNQLWRNLLLAISHRNTGEFDFGHVAIVHCDEDQTVRRAVGRLEQYLVDPHAVIRRVSFEKIVDELAGADELAEFAGLFSRRYLDLKPVMAA
jgi:hypothetical protein